MVKTVLAAAMFLAATYAFGQQANACDSASFEQIKDAVRTMMNQHLYSSWDEKPLYRAGDLVALVLVQTLKDDEILAPQNTKSLLTILHIAFECPQHCIAIPIDREPRLTKLLLEHLRNKVDRATQSKVDETWKFVLRQTGRGE
jgi:hypothetical protein